MNPIIPRASGPREQVWVPLSWNTGHSYRRTQLNTGEHINKIKTFGKVKKMKQNCLKSLSSGPHYPFLESRGKLSWITIWFPKPTVSLSASGRRFCCHREVRETYLDLFPEGPQPTALRLNIITSTLPRDERKWAFFPYWLSFPFWIQKYMYCPIFPLSPSPHAHIESQGLHQNCPVISAMDATLKFPVT